ncbi:MAG: methionine adenosyltransferase [Clostridiales bacterium]|nr:methionine adenosyltransferase [Clostridiales bacterium]
MSHYMFTSESVTCGHPDKICDRISDAVLDEIMRNDKFGRVACETCCTTGMVLVMGEITTSCYVDIPKVARRVICDIGYNDADMGFDGNTCAVLTAIDEQSPDIDMGVSQSYEAQNGDIDVYDICGAGDQGMMFGYACDETPEYMPMAASYAKKLTNKLTEARRSGEISYLRPDGKAQVTVEYDENNKPVRIDTVVVSTQHSDDVTLEQIRKDVEEKIIRAVIPASLLDDKTIFYINPTGRFVVGGPHGDSGLTGRKIIVDTYGGAARHGGGAFSGKDPTKVDRSASYAARYVAKNIVSASLASKCEVEIAYAIGVAHPVSVTVETFGTEKVSREKIEKAVKETFDLRPAAIIDHFDLRRPIYEDLAANGHFGRTDVDLPWERTDKTDELRERAGL